MLLLFRPSTPSNRNAEDREASKLLEEAPSAEADSLLFEELLLESPNSNSMASGIHDLVREPSDDLDDDLVKRPIILSLRCSVNINRFQ